jgi:hypothetical protein
MLALLSLRRMDGLHEATLLWIYAVFEQVIAIVNIAVYCELHVTALAMQEVRNEGGIVQNIDVVVSTWHSKEGVLNP